MSVVNRFSLNAMRPWLLLSCCGLLLLWGGFTYKLVMPSESPFYGIFRDDSNQTRYFALQGLKRPIITRSSLSEWVSLAVVAANTYTATDYDDVLGDVADNFFTQEGGDAFAADLFESGTIDRVVSQKMIVTAVTQGRPIILAQGELLGRYSYKVQVPIAVTFQSPSTVKAERFLVTLLVVEIPTWQSPRGLGIAQYQAVPV